MKLTVARSRREEGFALPTILLVATVMLTVLVASLAATAASRVSLDSQYYNQLASQAAQSGVARATECLKNDGYSPQWSTTTTGKNLRPDSDCSGAAMAGTHVRPYVLGVAGTTPSKVRTRYSVEAPSGTGIGSILRIVGTTELVRTSAPNAVWRSYEQSMFLRIEPPQKISCPTGFIAVPGDSRFGTEDFCVSKYEAKNVGGRAGVQASGLPYVNIDQNQAIAVAKEACEGCHLITEGEWLTLAHNVTNVGSNWSSGNVGTGYIYSGHNDNVPTGALAASTDDNAGYFGTSNTSGNQRRTLSLSNGEVIWDIAGNVWEWTSGQASSGFPGNGDYAYRDWNALGVTGTLNPSPFPSFGTPTAAGWTAAANGIGRLYSRDYETGTRGFGRGGFWNNTSSAGLFALSLGSTPAWTNSAWGFRIAYTPPRSDETVFVFDTNATGCTGTVQLPVSSPVSGGTVDWGDGTTVQPRTAALQSYTYSSPGVYTVKFRGSISQASYYSSVNTANANCLTRVERWANNISPTRVSFYRASNLVYVAEPPASVTNMSYMFYYASSFNQNISSWNTANVTDMRGMFYRAYAFNQPIGGWNTSNVRYMYNMFSLAYTFNQPIGNWNTSNVTGMSSMFNSANSFNQSLNNWDTSKVTEMDYMFYENDSFNGSIGSWNTAAVTDMNSMFAWTDAFNQPIGNWNTINVIHMGGMFEQAVAFNQPIGSWNTSNVTGMQYMFSNAHAFNQPLGSWNTSNVTNMVAMFNRVYTFNQPLSTWNTANVTNMGSMFQSAYAFNQPIGSWNISKVTNMSYMFYDANAFNQPLSTWNTAAVTNMSHMFYSAALFNQNISSWNVVAVTTWTNFHAGAPLTQANCPPKLW